MYVDHIGSAFLFRGGSPLTLSKKDFSYQNITETMRKHADGIGERPLFMDISLLNPEKTSDLGCIDVEQWFFGNHTQLGRFQLYPILGNNVKPSNFDCRRRRELVETLGYWTHDKLPAFVSGIRDTLKSFKPTNEYDSLVVYVHCKEGEDRTGEVIGAYQMTYQNVDLATFIRNDTALAGHPAPSQPHLNSLLWYQLWIQHIRGLNKIC